MIFATLLFVQAIPESPSLKCESTETFDCETGIYTGPPEQSLHSRDVEEAIEIHAPYLNCYIEQSFTLAVQANDEELNAEDVFGQAIAHCSEERALAIVEFDVFLSKYKRYGAAENKQMVAEKFRQQLWFFSLHRAFSAAGELDRFNKLLTPSKPTNEDVMRNNDGVLTHILGALEVTDSPHSNPSPKEEGLKNADVEKSLWASIEEIYQ